MDTRTGAYKPMSTLSLTLTLTLLPLPILTSLLLLTLILTLMLMLALTHCLSSAYLNKGKRLIVKRIWLEWM